MIPALPELKSENKPVIKGGPIIEVKLIILANPPCNSPCSVSGT